MTRISAHRGLPAIALLISVAACEADPKYTDPPRDSYAATTLTLRSNNRDTTVVAATVDPTFFASTGVHALLGRILIPASNAPAAREAVISRELWQGALQGDVTVIGRPITLNGESVVVVGILPKGFDFPPRTSIWVQRGLPVGK